jgi:hypothetical protein
MKCVKVKDGKNCTPVIKHRRGDLSVTSIGTAHIGESDYYKGIQARLDRLPVGFYEGVGDIVNEDNIPADKRKYIEDFDKLMNAYDGIAGYIGLDSQKLDYPDFWKNPDMGLEELIVKAPESFFKNASKMESMMESLGGLHETNPAELAGVMKKIMKCLDTVPYLRGAASVLTGGLKYNGVILEERNQMLFDALGSEIGRPSADEIGIVYGAAHMDGVDKFLRKNDFKREGIEWIPAWDLNTDVPFWSSLKVVMNYLKEQKKNVVAE